MNETTVRGKFLNTIEPVSGLLKTFKSGNTSQRKIYLRKPC